MQFFHLYISPHGQYQTYSNSHVLCSRFNFTVYYKNIIFLRDFFIFLNPNLWHDFIKYKNSIQIKFNAMFEKNVTIESNALKENINGYIVTFYFVLFEQFICILYDDNH